MPRAMLRRWRGWGSKTETGERRPENGDRKTETGDRKTENGERKTENGDGRRETKRCPVAAPIESGEPKPRLQNANGDRKTENV
jgi:hypothetical protein